MIFLKAINALEFVKNVKYLCNSFQLSNQKVGDEKVVQVNHNVARLPMKQ